VKLTAHSIVRAPVTVVQRIIDLALIAAILGFLILFGLQFPHSVKLDILWLTIHIRKYGDPAILAAGSLFNLTWPSRSTSFLPVAVALATWVVKLAVDALFLRGNRLLTKLLPGPRPVAASGAFGLPSSGIFGAVAATADTEQDREKLLKRYREIEKALKAAKRKHCTFLSIDVVGSTLMKVGEHETQVAATFQAYEEMLRKIFDQFGAWKQAWTPDGVMICFLDHELAVAAGQRVLQSLKKFNESENKLRTPFRVRCGLNEGEVAIYEDSKLEKVADHVIDVAGHMQKHGRENAMWVPAELYTGLTNKSGFRPLEVEVDGYKVCEWAPEPN
jgi:class 3 adenylate cyclase